jgi:hypothetical protein
VYFWICGLYVCFLICGLYFCALIFMYSRDIWPHFWMCHFSFINVVCEILKLICDLYKYILYLSHGKAKEKREKKGSSPSGRCPGTRGRLNLRKQEGAFPECLGIWHSGGLPRVLGHVVLGEG